MEQKKKTFQLENKKLSVIVPVYKTEKYLEKCLESLVHQTFHNLEIIIVDDASPDDAVSIVKEFQKEYKNIKLVSHKKNRGLFHARCTGMNSATGDFFAFLDSDDCVPLDFYRVLIKKAEETGADIVAADYLETFEDGTFYSPHNMLAQKDWDLQNEKCIDILMRQKGLDYGWWVVWNKIYARHLWTDSLSILQRQKNHLIMCEDIAFSVNFFIHAKRLVNVHNNYYYYYKHEDASTSERCTSEKYNKKITDILNAFLLAKEALVDRGFWETYHTDWQLWLNRILKQWKDKILNDTLLKRSEQKDLLSLIKNNVEEIEESSCDQDVNFCARGTKWNGWDLVADTKKAILDQTHSVVSFDIFDTLLLRPFEKPTDLFILMEPYVNSLVGSVDYLSFSELRIRAEQLARQRKAIDNPMWGEVLLTEIYQEIGKLCPKMAPVLQEIQKLENDMELRFCSERKLGKEYLECALAGGKKVICTSDMYLPIDTVNKMLKKAGYDGISKVYLSSEIGSCKWDGKLYKHVLREEKLKKPSELLHIGDNWESDICAAEKLGIAAKHLPKTMDIFRNGHGGIYSGQYYFHCFQEQKAYIDAAESIQTFGVRTMMGVIANRLYDNPFVMYLPNSDFNADIYTIGYFCLGMHLFAITDWLHQSIKENEFDQIHFIARDGYLPKLSFDIFNQVFQLPVKSNYTYMSRKAVLPLMIQGEKDFYALFNNFALNSLTPEKLLELTKSIISEDAKKSAREICEKNRIAYDRSFDTIEGVLLFGKIFFSNFYSDEKAKQYLDNLRAYLKDTLDGKVATFDVGYSIRIESTLAKSFNSDITAHYIHTNNDRFAGRMEHTGVKLKTLYGNKPFITGIMRELPLSELGPSCIGYETINGEFQPVFEEFHTNIQTEYIIRTMQEAALDFVKDMVNTFGKDIKHLSYRITDACLPFEYFLHFAKQPDRDLFRGIEFEDDMRMGNGINFVDFWNHELWRWGSVHLNEGDQSNTHVQSAQAIGSVDFGSFSFIKRWILIYILDWEEGKKRVRNYLKNRPVLLSRISNLYYMCRNVYRKRHPSGRAGK